MNEKETNDKLQRITKLLEIGGTMLAIAAATMARCNVSKAARASMIDDRACDNACDNPYDKQFTAL